MGADSRPALLSYAKVTVDIWIYVPGHTAMPTGRDVYSTDIRLVYSAGDFDFDCDVDFVDYAHLAVDSFRILAITAAKGFRVPKSGLSL